MEKEQVLREVKDLRDKISDRADPDAEWYNTVLDHLDRAGDAIEFPKVGP